MFKDRLYQLRISKGVSQAEVANSIGVSTSTIGNYEQGTRSPQNQDIWNRLANYFDVPLDYLMGRSDIPCAELNKQISSISEKAPFNQYLQHRKDVPFYYNGVNITSLFFDNTKEISPITTEQASAFILFKMHSDHVIFARRMLLTILYDIKEMTIAEITVNLSNVIERIYENVVYWYLQCWENIDENLPPAYSLESLCDLLWGCIAIDQIAQKTFYLVPLTDDFLWLREKLC